jgi:hypothetical protein
LSRTSLFMASELNNQDLVIQNPDMITPPLPT